jgi:hypothetical protein
VNNDAPGALTQNLYWALLHPLEVAVRVTLVPGGCGAAGLGVMPTEAHGVLAWRRYACSIPTSTTVDDPAARAQTPNV